LRIGSLLEKQTGLVSEDDGSVDGRDGSRSCSQEPLGLVNVVGSLSSSSDVLRVDGVDSVSTRSDAEDQGVL